MGLFSNPPSLIDPSQKDKDEYRGIVRGLLPRFPNAAKAIEGLLSETGLRLAREEGLSLTRQAIEVLETACKEHPESFFLQWRLCDLYMNADRFGDALALAKELAARFPKDPRSFYALGTVHHTLGRVREKELSPETLKGMRQALSATEIDMLLASKAIDTACSKLALTPAQASELAAQHFKRTLELGVRRSERAHVEECLAAATTAARKRKLNETF